MNLNNLLHGEGAKFLALLTVVRHDSIDGRKIISRGIQKIIQTRDCNRLQGFLSVGAAQRTSQVRMLNIIIGGEILRLAFCTDNH